VFTFFPGLVSDEMKACGIPVYSIGNDTAIESFAPEILHVHHPPCLYYLGALRLFLPGDLLLPWSPPDPRGPADFTWGGVAGGLAISEEVRDHLLSTPFGAAVSPSVLRNWFDDRTLQPARTLTRHNIRSVAVVTNHLDPQLRLDLEGIGARRRTFRWVHFGMPETASPSPPRPSGHSMR